MNQAIEKKARDYVENPPKVSEISRLFWERICLGEQIDVDEIVYDIISDFDHHFEGKENIINWFDEEDSDEKDSLREEVLNAIGYNDFSDCGFISYRHSMPEGDWWSDN